MKWFDFIWGLMIMGFAVYFMITGYQGINSVHPELVGPIATLVISLCMFDLARDTTRKP